MTEMTCIFSVPRLESTKEEGGKEGGSEGASEKRERERKTPLNYKSQNKPFMAPMRAQEVFQQALEWQIARRRGTPFGMQGRVG